MTLVLKGVMQSPVTPLKEDFSPDYATFERLVDFHVRTGATAISWPHHKAESLNLTMAERKALSEVAIKAVAKRVPISISQRAFGRGYIRFSPPCAKGRRRRHHRDHTILLEIPTRGNLRSFRQARNLHRSSDDRV